MKILVVSSTPWNINNSFGNSYSSIFDGMEDLQFANVYCSAGEPNNKFKMAYYQMTFKMVVDNLINSKKPAGHVVKMSDHKDISRDMIAGYETFKKIRLRCFFWAREFVWHIGHWKTIELENFIKDYNPDILFVPVYYSHYLSDIDLFAQKCCNKPMIGYISDDCYTLRQFSLSPLYWIERLLVRRHVKEVIDSTKLLYVISNIQKAEYERIFKVPCKVLTKGKDFSSDVPQYLSTDDTVRLVYAGNIGTGRWKSLSYVSSAVERLINEGRKIELLIYTSTVMTNSMRKALNRRGTSVLPPVSYQEIIEIQKKADILIHAEGLNLKNRLTVHQSFSTKLVDYFQLGKCILAIGTDDMASISHLRENDAAVIASSKDDVYKELKALVTDSSMREQYGVAAYKCGRKHHQLMEIQKMLREDMHLVAENEDHSN